jgi:hypothetical protein
MVKPPTNFNGQSPPESPSKRFDFDAKNVLHKSNFFYILLHAYFFFQLELFTHISSDDVCSVKAMLMKHVYDPDDIQQALFLFSPDLQKYIWSFLEFDVDIAYSNGNQKRIYMLPFFRWETDQFV